MLKAGDKAPAFELPSTGGGTVSSASLKGRKYVLYFYPKDDTPGCTREACDFRDNLRRLKKAGVEVLGVSKDSLASHGKFREKYRLPFDLLSDEDNSVARAYGAHGEKILYGKKTVGTIRSTYLIDEEGRVAAVWPKVKVDGHVDRILEHLAGSKKK
jgi:peroxiredoxin Q/BCP